MVPGQGMTIGRRLGGSGPIAFGREERGKVATVGGFDTFCDRTIAQRWRPPTDAIKEIRTEISETPTKTTFQWASLYETEIFSIFLWCQYDYELKEEDWFTEFWYLNSSTNLVQQRILQLSILSAGSPKYK